MRRLLAHRDIRIYLAGQVCSLFGDSTLWLAMGIWVKTLTGSNAQAGLVFFFFTAPSLLAPAAGLLADRVRRRPLLIGTNAATAAAPRWRSRRCCPRSWPATLSSARPSRGWSSG